MNGQPLPGFYYDSNKKKYFRIQSAAASRDLDLPYSAENIRKRERVESVQRTVAARSSRNRKERVVRRHASNLTHTCMEREIGFKRRSVYMHGTWPNACMSGVAAKPACILKKPAYYIRYFDRDPESRTIYAIHAENKILRHDYDWDNPSSGSSMDILCPPSGYNHGYETELGRTTSPISSLCYFPYTGALAVTAYGSGRPPVIQLSDPDRDGPSVSQQFTPKDCPVIWGLAPRPWTFDLPPAMANTVVATEREHLAVAASHSMLMFTRSSCGTWNSKIAVKPLSCPILSLDWLSYTTVAMGCRDGKVLLYDTRSGGSSHILTHPQPVTKIQRADDQTRIICSGLANSLHLYDIRSARPSSHRQVLSPGANTHYNDTYFSTLDASGPMRGKKRMKLDFINAARWSEPLLTFQHSNIDNPYLDVAVHRGLGLMAAAQDQQTDVAIRVWNIWTGEVVREFKRDASGSNGVVKKGFWWVIRTLKFVDDDLDMDCGLDLWATWEGGIVKFAL